MKRNWIVIIVVALLAGAALYQNIGGTKQVAGAKGEEPRKDYLAPTFVLEDANGEKYKVGGKRDKALLINFWASWCGPCHIEAPDLKAMYDKYNDRLDLYAVNITQLDLVEDAKTFVDHYEFTFPVLYDLKGAVMKQYLVDSYPTSFLVDKDGVIRDVIYGVLSPQELERRIKKLIGA